MNLRRYTFFAAALAAVLFLIWIIWPARTRPASSSEPSVTSGSLVPDDPDSSADDATTTVFAHNLELRKGPDFRIYVRWLRGQMLPTHANQTPSLDDDESFVFRIDRGLLHANLGDLDTYLNGKLVARSPLKQMKLRGEGAQITLSGTMHKLLVPLPVEVTGTLEPASNERVHVRVAKISVLKMPVKSLLGGLKVTIDDIMGKEPIPGVEIKDNDIYIEPMRVLPPPHVRGQISAIEVHAPDVVVTYGKTTPDDEQQLARWHNFLRLRGGAVTFGKLTMNKADLTLIDASDDTWFDLDLANYRTQMVKGYSRITPQNGIEMFMPDVGKGMPPGSLSLETLRDRSKPLPAPKTIK